MQIQNSFKEELVFQNTDFVQSDHTKHKPWFVVCRILILIYLLKFFVTQNCSEFFL